MAVRQPQTGIRKKERRATPSSETCSPFGLRDIGQETPTPPVFLTMCDLCVEEKFSKKLPSIPNFQETNPLGKEKEAL